MAGDRTWRDRDASEDLGRAAAVFAVGMALPVLVVLAAPRPLALYLDGAGFTALAALAFGLVLWVVVEARDVDRVDVAVAAVLAPAVGFVAALCGLVTLSVAIEGYGLGPWEPAVDYLAPTIGHLFGYVLAFAFAGFGALGAGRWVRRRSDLSPGRAATGTLAAVVVALALAGGVNALAATGASVASVEPGAVEYGSEPALNVTVAGPAAELRVVAVAPDGSRVTDRLSRRAMRGDGGTAALRVRFDDTPPPGYLPAQAGTYRVRLETLTGVTVDTATFTVERDPGVAITETVATRGNLSWNVTPRPPRAGDGEVVVGVAVEHRGPFRGTAAVALALPGDGRGSGLLFLAPGERRRVAFALSNETVRRVRAERDGVVRVRVTEGAARGPTGNATVRLPPEA